MALLENYIAQPLPLRGLEDGTIRVGDTRVSLDSVIHHFHRGRCGEDMVRSFNTLKLRDVYLVICLLFGQQRHGRCLCSKTPSRGR